MTAPDVIIMELGGRGRFPLPEKVAADFARVVLGNPRAEIGIAIGGYDRDARELFDIPEVMDWLRQFAAVLPLHLGAAMSAEDLLARLDTSTRALLMLAAGLIERHQIQIAGSA